QEVLLLPPDLVRLVFPGDRDPGVLLPGLHQLHRLVVGGERGLRAAKSEGELLVDDRQAGVGETDLGGEVLSLLRGGAPAGGEAGGQGQRGGAEGEAAAGERGVGQHEGTPSSVLDIGDTYDGSREGQTVGEALSS